MRIDPTYLNTVPPKNITKLDAPLTIETEVIVESVLDINEVGSTIQLQLTVELSWFDSRVEFIDVNPDGNPLTMEHKSTLWMPTLTFPNTKEKLSVFLRQLSTLTHCQGIIVKKRATFITLTQ